MYQPPTIPPPPRPPAPRVAQTLLWAVLVLGLLVILTPQRSTVTISSWQPGVQPGVSQATPMPSVDVQPVQPLTPAATAMNSYLQDLVRQGTFSGAVLVARDGKVLLSAGYGMADAKLGIANTPSTRFRLASVSKQFAAMAIMILQAQGKLNVHDSVCAHIDSCPAAWQAITIENLLNHTSGLPNYTDFGSYVATMATPTTPEELVLRFRDLPLRFAPGSQYAYNNSGYILAGFIAEKASGKAYAELVQELIFGPLQMQDSGYDLGDVERARGYRGPDTLSATIDMSTLFAAGGLYSTVEDLFRWDQSLYTPALLPDDLRAQIFTPNSAGYGYGWTIRSLDGHPAVSHPGFMSGASTFIIRLPNERATVIVLSNFEAAPAQAIAEHLARMALAS